MITPDKLYAATNDGLDIIALHYPAAVESARTNKPFKARPDERTPSARVKLYDTSRGRVWKMTDFGGEGRAVDPIQIHMDANNLNFAEAILDLAAHFGISDEISRSINRPDVRRQPASVDQVDGTCNWDIDQEFTEDQCRIMGPRVRPEHLKALHWYRVKWIVSVKNREAVYKYSNERYPIFMRECWFETKDGKRDRFYKIYEPLNPDKQWRFQYQPKGKKPQSYINGLEELKAKYKEYNDAQEAIFYKDTENENKSYKAKKLPEAIICSGERDAICVKALGFWPLWFNSETYQVTDEEWRTITNYVEKVYNIPDIDSTGVIKGTELALRFVDINTIWLPEKLSVYKDNRGKPRKDFRDWCEIWKERNDFRLLMDLATPAKFWKVRRKKRDEGAELSYSIDISCLHEFLKLNGFHTLRDKHASTTQFVHIVGNVVSIVTPKEIRDFVYKWVIANEPARDLRNLVLSTPTLSAASLEALHEVDPDFTNNTEHSQFFYFPKFSVEITGEGMTQRDIRVASTGRYVWDSDIIDHDIKILPDMFRITNASGGFGSEDFDIEILPHASNYFNYLINSSRLYWRKELEDSLDNRDKSIANAYKEVHKFDIAGPNLSEEEIREQKQCLINKIFTIGYMLHRYKSESRAWAPFVMDNVVGENDQCNGRSGKSFMFRALAHFTRWLKISGRNPRLLENQFAFEQINKHTGIVVVDDCDEYLPFKQFYDNITSDITINAKNVSAYNLLFHESPKFAFTTNYVPREFDSSTVGRMLFVVFSDYYHQQTEDNDYRETRPIFADFGKDLMGSTYPEKEWEADINFILQCVRFYLSVAHTQAKIEPQIGNIIFRKYLRDMSENFREWAEAYFAVDENGYGEHVDTDVVRTEAYEDYKKFSGAAKTTMQRFSKSLRGFCYTCDYIDCLNPEEMWTSGQRILKRVVDPVSNKPKQTEIIYVRTKAALERKSVDIQSILNAAANPGDPDPLGGD